MFVMIINILNNENTVTLSIFTKSSYNGWWKHDGFGHDVTRIGLGYPPPPPPPPFINEHPSPPHYGLPHNLYKNI